MNTTTTLLAKADAVINCWNKCCVNPTEYNQNRLCDSVCDLSVALDPDGTATGHALKAFDECGKLYDFVSKGAMGFRAYDMLGHIIFHIKSI